MINVLLVDDHEMVRLGVSSYLSMQDDIDVIAEAKNGREGVEKSLSYIATGSIDLPVYPINRTSF